MPPDKLDASQWLALNRDGWGIEAGLYQRLDVSHLDDLSRVRSPKAMHFMTMFRRISNSFCVHWISRQSRPHQRTTTDFFSAMNAEHHRYAFTILRSRHPSFITAS